MRILALLWRSGSSQEKIPTERLGYQSAIELELDEIRFVLINLHWKTLLAFGLAETN
jgi:hypothetical protein